MLAVVAHKTSTTGAEPRLVLCIDGDGPNPVRRQARFHGEVLKRASVVTREPLAHRANPQFASRSRGQGNHIIIDKSIQLGQLFKPALRVMSDAYVGEAYPDAVILRERQRGNEVRTGGYHLPKTAAIKAHQTFARVAPETRSKPERAVGRRQSRACLASLNGTGGVWRDQTVSQGEMRKIAGLHSAWYFDDSRFVQASS